MDLPGSGAPWLTCSASNEMLLVTFILSLVAAAAYHYFTVPGLCAEIARRQGLDERKWYFNGFVFSGLALLYLRSTLSPSDADLEKRINKVFLISVAFFVWLIGLAVLLD